MPDNKGKHERTFIMVKPDGVQRGLVGDIIKRFEQRGFKLVAMKFMQVRKRSSMACHFMVIQGVAELIFNYIYLYLPFAPMN